MPNNLLNVGATFDKTQVTEGVDGVRKDFKDLAANIDLSMNEASSSTKRQWKLISDASKEGAASASADSLRIVASYKANVQAQAEWTAAQKLLKGPMGETAEVIAVAAAVQEKASFSAKEYAASLHGVAEASHSVVTGQQAASAAIRSLEGNAGLRAVENFTAKTLGLGPALQAIFPVIGALAFGEILLSMGTKVNDLEQKTRHSNEAMNEGFAAMHERAQVTIDDQAVISAKLQDEIDKLSGHPNNGLQTALAEAQQAADKLLASLKADNKELKELFKQNNVSTTASLLDGLFSNRPKASTKDDEADVLKKQQEMHDKISALEQERNAKFAANHDPQKAKQITDEYNKAVVGAQNDYVGYLHGQAENRKKQENSELSENALKMNAGLHGGPVADRSNEVSIYEGAAKQGEGERDKFIGGNKIEQQREQVGKLKQDKANDAGGTDDAAKAQLKDIEAQFAELNAATANIKGHGLTSEDALAFWAPYLGTFKARSDEAKKILEEVAKAQDGIHKQILEASKKIKEETARIDAEGDKAIPKGNEAAAKMLKEQSDDALRAGEKWAGYWAAVTQGQEQQARIAEEIALTRVKLDEENGALTHVGAAQKTAALHAKEHEDALRALRLELEKLNAEAKRDPLTGAVADPKQAKQIQDVQNRIATETGKGQQQKGQDQKAVADAMAKPYLAAFNTIENGWMSAQRAMLTGQQSLATAMRSMWSNIALDALESFERTQLKYAKDQILMVAQHAAASGDHKGITLAEEIYNKVMHTGTATAKAATDTAASATQQATAAAANVATAQSYAAVAGAAGVASTAAIPIVGPALAPAAGAAMFGVASTYTALAAFEQGTMYIPKAGAAVLHPGEAVLGSPSAQVMRDAMSGKLAGAGGGGDLHLHMGGNTINGNGGSFAQQLSQNETHLVGMLNSMHRRGKLKFAR